MAIYCIGRNYAQHAAELGNAIPDFPVIFTKPSSAVSRDRVVLPRDLGRVDHEAEIVIRMGARLKNADASEALNAISGIALGIDVTARDLQEELKAKKLPWDRAKGRDTFAVCSDFHTGAEIRDAAVLSDLAIEFSVNGQVRQSGNSRDMIFPIAKLIQIVSREFTLDVGDWIYTGTPEGVGPLSPRDRMTGRLLGPAAQGTGGRAVWATLSAECVE